MTVVSADALVILSTLKKKTFARETEELLYSRLTWLLTLKVKTIGNIKYLASKLVPSDFKTSHMLLIAHGGRYAPLISIL